MISYDFKIIAFNFILKLVSIIWYNKVKKGVKMNFNKWDMKIVRELLNITQEELADELNVEPLTIKRIENGITNTSKRTLDLFYDFVYKKRIYLNKIKEMFYKEELIKEKLLFHGAKSTTVINSILTVRNPAALSITPLAGGTRSVSAHLIITQIG